MRADAPLAARSFISRNDLERVALIATDRPSLQKEIRNWLGDENTLNLAATYKIITNAAYLVK